VAARAHTIVIATLGSLGDLHPFMALGQELQKRGYAPVIATVPCYRHAVAESGLAFHPMRPDIGMDDQWLMRSIVRSRRGLDSLVADHLLPHLRQSFDDLMTCTEGAAAMIVGSLSYAAPLVAERCGVPWCSAILSPMYAAMRRDPSPLRALAPLGGAAASIQRAIIRAASLWPTRANVLVQYSRRLVLALFSKVLGTRGDFPASTVVTGFALYGGRHATPTPPALERFLTHADAPLVFTLGSNVVFDPGTFFEESVVAARRLGRRAVLLTGPNPPPPDLADDVLAIPYAPFSTLFPHAAAVVHQGGIGTIGQTLRSGRPMLVVPRGLDQPDNAVRIRRLGVGRVIHASAYTGDAAAAEIERLLGNPGYAARAREVGAVLRLENGTVTACNAIERAIGDRQPAEPVLHLDTRLKRQQSTV
jgi:UDP:flavonoid glycosyltransferase YjiC (YdhE family)